MAHGVNADALTGAIDYATWDDPGDPFFDLATLQDEIVNVLDGNILDDSGATAPEPEAITLLAIGTLGILGFPKTSRS